MGDYAAAERILSDAIVASPEVSDLHGTLGRLMRKQHRDGEAIAAFQEALRCAPHHAGYILELERMNGSLVSAG